MSSHLSPVVVGFEFGHSGSAALHRAVILAARAPFHVLHVVCVIDPAEAIPTIPPYNGIDHMYAARVQEAITAEIHSELDKAEVHDRVHFFVHARIGKPAQEILALARDVGADLIIVGSEWMTGASHIRLGSISEQVVREAGCAVEIARAKQYAEVTRMPIELELMEPHPAYVQPHHYIYEDHRVNVHFAESLLPSS